MSTSTQSRSTQTEERRLATPGAIAMDDREEPNGYSSGTARFTR
jgi:hypothetical protein